MKRCKYALLKKISSRYKLPVMAVTFVCMICMNIYYRPVEVKAVTDSTLGEFILSLFASQGLGLCDPNILSAVQSTMGNAIAVGAEGIQNAITAFETATGGCDVITKTFTTTAGQAVTYVQQVGAENIIYVKEFGASAAENISAAIENYQNFGFVAPAVGGMSIVPTAGVATLAVGAGVALGFGINAFREFITPYIKSAMGITVRLDPNAGMQAWGMVTRNGNKYVNRTYGNPNLITGWWYSDTAVNGNPGYILWLVNRGERIWNRIPNTDTYYQTMYLPPDYKDSQAATTVILDDYIWREQISVPGEGFFGNPEDYLSNGNVTTRSPDVITTYGNADSSQGILDDPDMGYIRPIPMEEYQQWADQAQQNTSGGINTAPQGDAFKDLVDRYVLPDGPNVQPTPVPEPTTAPQPTADPVAPVWPQTNPNPVNPIQPTYLPFPTSDPDAQPTAVPVVPPDGDLTPEQTGDILKKGRIPGLENIFPFCIPFDIASLVKKLNVTRQAPVIEWHSEFGSWGSFGDVRIDLSTFDSVASLARTFELILFLLGLMIITKNLIGW